MGRTVLKEINFPRYNIKCSGGNAEYFMKYHVFHYIACYIAEIWITFRTVGDGANENTVARSGGDSTSISK